MGHGGDLPALLFSDRHHEQHIRAVWKTGEIEPFARPFGQARRRERPEASRSFTA